MTNEGTSFIRGHIHNQECESRNKYPVILPMLFSKYSLIMNLPVGESLHAEVSPLGPPSIPLCQLRDSNTKS